MKKSRILGVDLGLKRTGLAVSDELWLTTRPLENLLPRSRAEDIAYLLHLCETLEIGVVVIGDPVLPKSGDEGMMAKRARGFAEALNKAAQDEGLVLQVVMVDESMTSKEAAMRLVSSGVAKKKRRRALDSEVARILVEQYIETQPRSQS